MCNEADIHLGRKIFVRRRLLGMTQKQLAEACGVRFQQIQKYECGANRISAVRLWLLAEALQTRIDYFFEGLPREVVAHMGESGRTAGGRPAHGRDLAA